MLVKHVALTKEEKGYVLLGDGSMIIIRDMILPKKKRNKSRIMSGLGSPDQRKAKTLAFKGKEEEIPFPLGSCTAFSCARHISSAVLFCWTEYEHWFCSWDCSLSVEALCHRLLEDWMSNTAGGCRLMNSTYLCMPHMPHMDWVLCPGWKNTKKDCLRTGHPTKPCYLGFLPHEFWVNLGWLEEADEIAWARRWKGLSTDSTTVHAFGETFGQLPSFLVWIPNIRYWPWMVRRDRWISCLCARTKTSQQTCTSVHVFGETSG